MTSVYVWLAMQLRGLAQWLDPLPDTEAAFVSALTEQRQALDGLRATQADADVAHANQVRDYESDLRKARTALEQFRAAHECCVPVPHDALYVKAQALTAQWASVPAPSGEFRRHQVLSALIDAFPTRSHRDLALAIEAALQGTR